MPTATASSTPLPGGSALLRTGPGSLHGWSFRESAAAVASWRLRDGTTAAGPIIAVGAFASGGTDTSVVDVRFQTGLYFEAVAGTIEGSVWLS